MSEDATVTDGENSLDCSCLFSVPSFSSWLTPIRSSGTSWVGASSAVILRSRSASSDLCMTIQDNAVDE